MTNFLTEFTRRIKKLSNDRQLRNLYRWLWNNQDNIKDTVETLNKELVLKGKNKLRSDLPCVSVGSRSGLLVVGANPGWKESKKGKKGNRYEDQLCRRSREDYEDLMTNWFERFPEVMGRPIRYWTGRFFLMRLIRNGDSSIWESGSRKEKWKEAHASQLIGGWELIPFHSQSDGVTEKIEVHKPLEDLVTASLHAALRFKPKVLFVASKAGYKLVRDILLPTQQWKDGFVGTGKYRTQLSYCRYTDRTEVILLKRQLTAPRKYKNKKIITNIDRLRKLR